MGLFDTIKETVGNVVNDISSFFSDLIGSDDNKGSDSPGSNRSGPKNVSEISNSYYNDQQVNAAQSVEEFNKSLDERLNSLLDKAQQTADSNQERIENSANKALERYMKSIEAQNKWTAMREDTSVKRLMAQLKEAGLNPKMAYSMFNFSTSPSASSGFSSHQTSTASMPSAQDYSNPISSVVQLMVAEIQKSSNLSASEMNNVTKALTTFLPLLLSVI